MAAGCDAATPQPGKDFADPISDVLHAKNCKEWLSNVKASRGLFFMHFAKPGCREQANVATYPAQ